MRQIDTHTLQDKWTVTKRDKILENKLHNGRKAQALTCMRGKPLPLFSALSLVEFLGVVLVEAYMSLSSPCMAKGLINSSEQISVQLSVLCRSSMNSV